MRARDFGELHMNKATNLVAWVLALGLLVTASGVAQDSKEATTEADTSESQSNDEKAEPTDAPEVIVESADSLSTAAPMERFDPTEKISEDSSVSFPVDI